MSKTVTMWKLEATVRDVAKQSRHADELPLTRKEIIEALSRIELPAGVSIKWKFVGGPIRTDGRTLSGKDFK